MGGPPMSRGHLRVLRVLAALDASLLGAGLVLALDRRVDVLVILAPSHVIVFGLLVATAAMAVRQRFWESGFVVQVVSLGPAALIPQLERRYRRTRP